MVTIRDSKADLERSLADVLHGLLPQTAGYALEVDIYENDRKKRSDASRENWRPAIGEIRIRFGGPTDTSPAPQSALRPTQRSEGATAYESPVTSGHVGLEHQQAELIDSLKTAEQRPGFSFVALKWFRDLCLPAEEYEWAASRSDRDELIRRAIEEGIILTHKVPNPKTPAFPVTAIRLNRRHPEVVAALGEGDVAADSFEPVEIHGEPLSATVLRERR